MDIQIKNFGPIAEGDVSIKPLTIFIGPNNTGKSYAAVLVWCLYSAFNNLHITPWGLPIHLRRKRFTRSRVKEEPLRFFREDNRAVDAWINGAIGTLKKDGKFESEIPEDILLDIHLNMFHLFTELLNEEISRAFASNLKNMVRLKTRSFSFVIDFNGFTLSLEYANNQLNLLSIEGITNRTLKIHLNTTTKDERWAIRTKKATLKNIEIDINPQFIKEVPHEILVSDIQEVLTQNILERYMEQMMRECYYLPAARSGILQGHKAVSAAIISEAPLAGLRKIEIPTLSGITADFIISLIELEPISERKSNLEEVIKPIEKDIIKGKISIQQIKHLYPEFAYEYQGLSLPLHRTSSMVSELAPIVLYLRHLVDKDDILIIEEPEAHLHPEMQRILAGVITLLIRNGVNVLITTHSDYLIEQISNFIKMSKIKEKDRVSMGYTKDDFLKPGEVSVHLFKYRDKEGTITEKLKVGREGIPQEEFGKVAQSLYEEKVKLQRKLGG
ncbi:MAG: hypothetical protein A7316_07640 [Candidatus Altiarchaeales archaeon WOR_SM1_86-2]|nr:MAG: hypothetical protein A7315_13545 [Candidatus Altiarchaeales archaeon WOR_SM1_79]ODS38603.1 MAG: hypothetical protein A7316_07640 [Candidatus Altiarchaeales archaeon WOR_SM1_86-2]